MNDTTSPTPAELPAIPDRLSVDPKSPHFNRDVLQHDIGVRFNNVNRNDVEEYCISESWIKVQAGKTLDRKGRPLLIKLTGKIEVFYQNV